MAGDLICLHFSALKMSPDLIEAFLMKEGRPWHLNDIHSKGFKDIPKNSLKNSLDMLVKKNKITSKQNIYCYNFKNHKVNHVSS